MMLSLYEQQRNLYQEIEYKIARLADHLKDRGVEIRKIVKHKGAFASAFICSIPMDSKENGLRIQTIIKIANNTPLGVYDLDWSKNHLSNSVGILKLAHERKVGCVPRLIGSNGQVNLTHEFFITSSISSSDMIKRRFREALILSLTALQELHKARLVHGDLHSSNLIFTSIDDVPKSCCLIDMGKATDVKQLTKEDVQKVNIDFKELLSTFLFEIGCLTHSDFLTIGEFGNHVFKSFKEIKPSTFTKLLELGMNENEATLLISLYEENPISQFDEVVNKESELIALLSSSLEIKSFSHFLPKSEVEVDSYAEAYIILGEINDYLMNLNNS